MKKVAILGRPNVGKSSLFNRLAKKRDAITSEVSGTTRDIKKNIITTLENREFELLDTGGIDESNELFKEVAKKSMQAAKEADIIVYMVDGQIIPQDEDKELFWQLQELNKPIALVVNKIDNDKLLNERFWEFSEFGAQDIFAISVSHNRGLNSFYKWLEKHIEPNMNNKIIQDSDIPLELLLQEQEEELKEEKEFKVAIIGRVNTGKSSLLNALLKEDRSIVSDVAGTTIDPVDETIEYNDYKITFVDTAGIRRRGKIVGIEKYALNRTENMLKQADIAILLIDAFG
jgi:GTP-binding protein